MREKYLEGEKIFLCPVEESDASVLQKIQNDEIARKFMSPCLPKTIEDVQKDIRSTKKNGFPYFLILKNTQKEKEDNEIIGYVKLEILSNFIRAAEIHIAISHEFTKCGYGTETINLITNYAFDELNIHSVRAFIKAKNISSIKAFEKQNYRKAGTLIEGAFYEGKYCDCYIYECIQKYLEK